MKIAKVSHYRCNEYRETTFVWVDDEMTEEEFIAFVELAHKSYLAVEESWNADKTAPPNLYQPDWDKHPDMLVRDVLAEFKTLCAARSDWQKRKQEALRNFATHLVEVGGGRIVEFYRYPGINSCSARVNWGHRHGNTPEYGETNPTEDDVRGPAAPTKDEEDWL